MAEGMEEGPGDTACASSVPAETLLCSQTAALPRAQAPCRDQGSQDRLQRRDKPDSE